MPSMDLYRKLHGSHTIGREHKQQSDMVMNATWNNDIGACVAYLYDYYHDVESFEKYKLRDLHPEGDDQKIPIDIKFQEYSSQTFSKDKVTFHLMLRPGQECNVPYYDEKYGPYESIFPTSLYVDIPDEAGQYNKWLVVNTANYYGPQFPTFEILPCDYVFQYVFEGKKYQIAGNTRGLNSYTSGVFIDFKITSMDDVSKMIVPLNEDTEHLFYNQRIIVDVKGLRTEPRAFVMSKINRISMRGAVEITLKQSTFNEHTDYIELDENGRAIGYYADYYNGDVTPTPADEPSYPSLHSVITYKGKQDGLLKVGGNGRKTVVTFYDIDNEVVEHQEGSWFVTIDGQEASDYIKVEPTLSGETAKIKPVDDDSIIGKTAVISYVTLDGIKSSLELNIVGL